MPENLGRGSSHRRRFGGVPASPQDVTLHGDFSPEPSGNYTDEELMFLKAAVVGDIEKIRWLTNQYLVYAQFFDLNCTDQLDRTALSIAIVQGHVDIVKFLLEADLQELSLGESLFYAIKIEAYEIIEILLEKDPQTTLKIPLGTTSPFDPGLTPFKQASRKNNYRILSMLYKYSHRLDFTSNNNIVTESLNEWSWDAVNERILHYEAQASPAFLLLMFEHRGMSWDPLNVSMDLFGKMRKLAKLEQEVEEKYSEMALTFENFAVELLTEVRSSIELADLMSFSLSDDNDDTYFDINTNDSCNKHLLKPFKKGGKK